MAPDTLSDSERSERLLKRCIMRRDGAIQDMNDLHKLAVKAKGDISCKALFFARKADIEQFMADITVEQDTIMDALLDAGRDSEYVNIHAPLIREVKNQYYFIHATAQELTVEPQPVQNVRTNLHLPKIKLPSFSGDILQWPTFRDKFVALVDSDPDLSPIEKFHLLAGCVTDRAATVVNSLKMTDMNYPIVWRKLIDQFDNPRLSASTLVDGLLSFRRMEFETVPGLSAFLHVFDESLQSLKMFDIEDVSSFIMFVLANKNLPRGTRELFEKNSNTFPGIEDLVKFVRCRIKILENIDGAAGKHMPKDKSNGRFSGKPTGKLMMVSAQGDANPKCPICKAPHDIQVCSEFLSMQAPKRFKMITSFRRCFRCLSATHVSSACTSDVFCVTCKGSHHSLLHFQKSRVRPPSVNGGSSASAPSGMNRGASPSPVSTSAVSHVGKMGPSTVVLGTALAHTRDRFGQTVDVRVLVDSGSQISAITESCAHHLGLTITKWTVPVSGLAGVTLPTVKGLTSCTITPRFESNTELEVNTWVLPTITVNLPTSPLPASIKSSYAHLALADPKFDIPATIDLLLGADLYHHVFDGKQYSEEGNPTAYSSIFGWILIGPVYPAAASYHQAVVVSLATSLEDMVRKFWEVDEPTTAPSETTEDGFCEKLFFEHTMIDRSGRYIVPLPFRDANPQEMLKGTRNIAQKRFLNLERRLILNPTLYEAYRDFMAEYVRLGHMQVANTPGDYIIPHHAVTKDENGKLKIRVVFDASSRSSGGHSLNDVLLTGPKLQNDITDILLRFRFPRFVFVADICKMYRQILIRPEHRSFQHILWRPSPADELIEYELNTVTYGTGPAPYLAIKVLHRVAESCRAKHPKVHEALFHNTYVDDVCAGDDVLDGVLDLQRDLMAVLAKHGFELKKWTSNCDEVLARIDPSSRSETTIPFENSEDAYVRVLGSHWDPAHDVIGYHVSSELGVYTKRGVLSVIARLYDPIGMLAPVTFWAKDLLQRLWKLGLHWDSELPPDLLNQWRTYLEDLPAVSQSTLPRHIDIVSATEIHLCGFCDASNKGYAAVVYIRVYTRSTINIYLLGAKSKVAPVKIMTTPRLELCGALLLAKWMDRLKTALEPQVNIDKMYSWTDSSIVLSWLVSPQINYKIFVTNRIAKIRQLLPDCQWNHVPSEDNPADCVSRGLLASQLAKYTLYWNGPKLLRDLEPTDGQFIPIPPDELPELKSHGPLVSLVNTTSDFAGIISRYSSLSCAQRVFALVWRFIAKTKKCQPGNGLIHRSELQKALDTLVYMTQRQYFGTWMEKLHDSPPSNIPNSFRKLKPYLDECGIIRVGGRLRNSNLSEHAKFPMLVPKGSHIASLILQHYHRCYLHAGPRALGSVVSRVFWITSARNEIRKVIHRCITCTKWAAVHPQPIMADLPTSRITPSRPFCHVGIDYGGPFIVRESRRRKAREYKAYMALFVCFATKAVHIETVTELSTEAFLAAFDRFIARRGSPTDVYTDCGTNFVGAERQLQTLLGLEKEQSIVINDTTCNWHFNPPAAPHFGGLWEAGIKSAKFHLKRAIGTQVLTFEELTTLLTRVEGILNSRPLTPLSSDPSEIDCLTPGHFLIGQPLVALPELDLTLTKQNCLTRWQLLRQCNQQFWHRWSHEYLSTLQVRSKWTSPGSTLAVGDVVIIKTPHTPPTVWPTGRITEVHPGKDDVVRVVTLKTAKGTTKRPAVQLVKLPTDA